MLISARDCFTSASLVSLRNERSTKSRMPTRPLTTALSSTATRGSMGTMSARRFTSTMALPPSRTPCISVILAHIFGSLPRSSSMRHCMPRIQSSCVTMPDLSKSKSEQRLKQSVRSVICCFLGGAGLASEP